MTGPNPWLPSIVALFFGTGGFRARPTRRVIVSTHAFGQGAPAGAAARRTADVGATTLPRFRSDSGAEVLTNPIICAQAGVIALITI